MKVISKEKIHLHTDREGKVEEFVIIEITQGAKDDENKLYHFHTRDMMLLNRGTEEEREEVVINRFGVSQSKSYTRTYEEVDTHKEILKELFPTDLTGSELDDYLLLMGLMYNLQSDPIYFSEFEPYVKLEITPIEDEDENK